jgi:[protein-PII] uridylyltransferase
VRRYLDERQELMRAAVPGLSSARRLARMTDEMLTELAEGPAAASLPRRIRWCLLALGGYGAGALLPESDLDLLVVSNASATNLRPFVESLLYPLWDAGLSVGHQVRSRREQVAAARDDLTILTATLTGRVVAGDAALGIDVLRACATDAAKRARDVLPLLHERSRPGSPYLLEPDLKDGAGGRRDFDELTWTAAVLTGVPQSDPSPLVSLGLLGEEQHARLEQAADVVCAARWELQRAGASSLMTEEAASDLQTDPTGVQRAIADTHHLLLRTRRRIAGRGLPDDGPLAPQSFFDTVSGGSPALPELEDAAWAGRLDHLVPGMSELMLLRRPGIAHTLTVGAHSLVCATGSADIISSGAESAAQTDPILAASARRVEDVHALWVAALTHDIGKSEPGPGHPERGASAARAAAGRFGLDDAGTKCVAALVSQHLLLPGAASAVDLDDPEDITRIADVLGDPGLLAPLHVLTVSDSRATGPGAWSPWHAALVGTLVSRLDSAFSHDEWNGTAAAPLEECRLEALLVRVAADPTPGAHALDVGAGPISGTFRVTIAARDRPGLLATIAGTFALAGLDILAAHSAPTRHDVAVDSFVVTSATLAPVAAESWNRLERQLSAALAGRLALTVRLAERRRHYTSRIAGAPVIEIVEEQRGAVLRVRAPDRVGLLYDVARAVSESGLDVRSLTATSRAGWAEDTLRLEHAATGGAGALGQLAMRLRDL